MWSAQRHSGPCGKQNLESPALDFIGCSGKTPSVGTSSSATDPMACSWTAASSQKRDSWPTPNHTPMGMPRLAHPSTTTFVVSSKRSSRDRIGLGRAGESSRLHIISEGGPAHALLITMCVPLTGVQAPLIKVMSIYEHKRVRRVLVPEWTALSQNRYIIG